MVSAEWTHHDSSINGYSTRTPVLMMRIPRSLHFHLPTWLPVISQAHPLRGVLLGGCMLKRDWLLDEVLLVVEVGIKCGDCDAVSRVCIVQSRTGYPSSRHPGVPIRYSCPWVVVDVTMPMLCPGNRKRHAVRHATQARSQ